MRRRTRVAGIGILSAVLLQTVPAGAHPGPVALEAAVDGAVVARTNHRLVGVGWDAAPFTAAKMSALRPDLARIDAGIERLYPRGPKRDPSAIAALTKEVRAARSIGAEPVVILGYTPSWLADDRPSSDRTKVPPSDAATYQQLVASTVEALDRLGVRFFEVWNEPDLPVFFQGLVSEFLDRIFRPSAQAVLDVERRTHHDLRFGGCACFFPDPAWIVPMITYARANSLPLDFISWHHYGNTPFLGPDGTEPLGPPEFRALLGPLHRRSPVAAASTYGDQVEMVRSWRDALFPGAETRPELWIDEWNLSAGGFDHRHDVADGAAFQASVLIEMQRSGLDRASMFRSVDPAYGPDVVPPRPELYGGWGLVGRRGTIKPAWRAQRFWRELGAEVLAFSQAQDGRLGVSAVLTRRNPRGWAALAASFDATDGHPHAIELRIRGVGTGRWSVSVHGLDGSVRRSGVSARGDLVVPVVLEPQNAVFVELRRVA
jgi:xylan 1,4-beta-xylosidase